MKGVICFLCRHQFDDDNVKRDKKLFYQFGFCPDCQRKLIASFEMQMRILRLKGDK